MGVGGYYETKMAYLAKQLVVVVLEENRPCESEHLELEHAPEATTDNLTMNQHMDPSWAPGPAGFVENSPTENTTKGPCDVERAQSLDRFR